MLMSRVLCIWSGIFMVIGVLLFIFVDPRSGGFFLFVPFSGVFVSCLFELKDERRVRREALKAHVSGDRFIRAGEIIGVDPRSSLRILEAFKAQGKIPEDMEILS